MLESGGNPPPQYLWHPPTLTDTLIANPNSVAWTLGLSETRTAWHFSADYRQGLGPKSVLLSRI